MKFTKMQGCGNDYVYVNCIEKELENSNEIAKVVSNRHFGVGGDGMIMICSSDKADFRMKMLNADGSEGAMCGNGIRCVAKYVYDYKLTNKENLSIETPSGIKYLDLTTENNKVVEVTVNMGSPILEAKLIPVISDNDKVIAEPIDIDGVEYKITCVSMGNPHAIVFVEDTKNFQVEKIGPSFENNKIFPDRVNTEFIQVIDRNTISMRVWERGSGETLACGTGACASVVACVLNGKTEDEVTVKLLGGDLKIKYDREQNLVFMTGPAVIVFEGEIEL
ncbi:diaminopimelate epimerase [Anaeromicropila herbilytica]|uniref:Diaminopimelate epimerase n=1 Tax=Anaeromicropila herbilytica TaxID=2785025 RepID=A0A7R7ICL2_9FIRM|nr:diaminopimelate epimerase [Anaeromicropila herbilytica]BCN29991.1 diaminopimelate epimerase [Anaeromicropila herbilytica]